MSETGMKAGAAPLATSALPEAGDVVLFSGKGWSSDVVRLFTRSCWSHVGLVVRDLAHTEPLLLEANTLSEVSDVRTGRQMPGVSLVALTDKLHAYEGRVVIRRWHGEESVDHRREKLAALAHDLLHRPYCNYVASWICRGLRTLPRGMFCSELVAEVYRRAGWLPADFNPARAVPAHFAGDGLPLLKGGLSSPLCVAQTERKCRTDEQVFA